MPWKARVLGRTSEMTWNVLLEFTSNEPHCVLCDCETARGDYALCEPCEGHCADIALRLFRAGLIENPRIWVEPVRAWRYC